MSLVERVKARLFPVDRTNTVLTNGHATNADRTHAKIDDQSGLQRAYIVLTEAERARGFVRPVRHSYRHLMCHGVTTMNSAIAETYARDPTFYHATFCATCRRHFSLAAFVWTDDGSPVGS